MTGRSSLTFKGTDTESTLSECTRAHEHARSEASETCVHLLKRSIIRGLVTVLEVFQCISKNRHFLWPGASVESFCHGGQCLILVSTKHRLHRYPGAVRLLSNHQTSEERPGVFSVLDSDTHSTKDKASSTLSHKKNMQHQTGGYQVSQCSVCALSQRYTAKYNTCVALYVGVNTCETVKTKAAAVSNAAFFFFFFSVQ